MPYPRHQDISVAAFISHYADKRPINWSSHFRQERPLCVEIGVGLGDYLVRSACREPEKNFIGIEQDWKLVKRTLGKIQLTAKGHRVQCLENVRLLQVDATVALERLFALQTIDNIYCLFPCPWPKKGHIKHRLFSRSFLQLMNSRLVPGGSAQIITDYQPYYDWMCEEIEGTGFQVEKNKVAPQFDTKYERKWLAAGQDRFFELHLTKDQHIEIPLEKDVTLKTYFADHFNPKRLPFKDVTGDTAIIFKEFLYDPVHSKAMVHMVVAEKSITQHVWVIIVKCSKGWCIAKAEGHTCLPTKGVFLAIRHVWHEVSRSNEKV